MHSSWGLAYPLNEKSRALSWLSLRNSITAGEVYTRVPREVKRIFLVVSYREIRRFILCIAASTLFHEETQFYFYRYRLPRQPRILYNRRPLAATRLQLFADRDICKIPALVTAYNCSRKCSTIYRNFFYGYT